MMKKSLLFIAFSAIATISFAQNAIPNAGLENWTQMVGTAGPYDEPDNLTTGNQLSGTPFFNNGKQVITATKVTGADKYSGEFALKLFNVVSLTDTMPGIAMSAPLSELALGNYFAGFPIEGQKPVKLKGFYKYDKKGQDEGSILVILSQEGESQPVAFAQLVISESQATYKEFSIDIEYQNPDATPDTASFIFQSSTYSSFDTSASITDGTALYIDELSFDYGSAKADFSFTPKLPKTGQAVKFTNNSTGNSDSVKWEFGVAGAISKELNPSYTYSDTGSYSVKLTVYDGANTSVKSKTVKVSLSTGIDSKNSIVTGIYPNPVQNVLNVKLGRSITGTANIVNTLGQVVRTLSFDNSAQLNIETAELTNGLYFISIINAQGNEMGSQRFQVQK